jgi:acetolactate synthase I/II/III large subunit
MIKLSDFIVKFLVKNDIKNVFMLTGGGAMHLNDSIGRSPDLEYICYHHEQACAIASEGFARYKGKPAVVCVTSGPGGTNSITGVLGEWLDSIPAIYISGQVRYDTTVASTGLPLRQFGSQEADIISIVKPITKYAVMVTDPLSIRYHLEKALFYAQSGRPGPVWLDIPLNIQGALIDEKQLISFDPSLEPDLFHLPMVLEQIEELCDRLTSAKRPVLLGGMGVRLSGAEKLFRKLAEALNIPVQLALDAIDLFPSSHPLYGGRPNIFGMRGANLIFQNCDLLLSIGCLLTPLQIGYNFPAVAREAYKVSVDIDYYELRKPTILIDLPIHSDPGCFIELLLAKIAQKKMGSDRSAWIEWCQDKIQKFPVIQKSYFEKENPVNPYVFISEINKASSAEDIFVSSNAFSANIPIQALEIQDGQRYLVNCGCGNMGYGLPAAIGACFGSGRKRVICFEGDGSLQLNIQELQTIFHHQLPIKIFIFNNGGYQSIRTTQENMFNGFLVGESLTSGVSFPDYVKVAEAYRIPGLRIESHSQLSEGIARALNTDGPFICDVCMDPEQRLSPRTVSKRLPDGRIISPPLEDLWPFLSSEELEKNMIIPKWDNGNS